MVQSPGPMGVVDVLISFGGAWAKKNEIIIMVEKLQLYKLPPYAIAALL